MNYLKKNLDVLIVFGLLILAVFLRTYRLPEFIAYHQDQVRDLLYVKEHIDSGQFIFLGPKASVGNFYLAPLWYYLMGIAYLVSHSPVAPALLVAILNSLATVLLYLFLKKFFDRETATVASLIYAVSPFSIEYSRFAWNPNPIPFFTILAIYALFIYIYEKRNNFIYLAVIASNFAFQSHYQGFLLVASVFFFIVIRKDWKRLVWSALLFVALLAPFLFYELTHGLPNIGQIFSFLGRTTHGRTLGIANSFRAFTNDYPEFIARAMFFGYKPLGLIASLATYVLVAKRIFTKTVGRIDKEKGIFIIFFILLFTLFAYRQWIVPYYLLVTLIPLIIITTLALGRFKRILLILVLINLLVSPAFAKTDSSLRFFEKSLSIFNQSGLSKNCLKYEISDPDLKFAPQAVDYLLFYKNLPYQANSYCQNNLVFCQKDLCDKIKGVEKLRSDFLGIRLVEK